MSKNILPSALSVPRLMPLITFSFVFYVIIITFSDLFEISLVYLKHPIVEETNKADILEPESITFSYKTEIT